MGYKDAYSNYFKYINNQPMTVDELKLALNEASELYVSYSRLPSKEADIVFLDIASIHQLIRQLE